MKKEFILRGLVNKIDIVNKKLEVLYPPEAIDTFTRTFLIGYFPNRNTPLSPNGYSVKYSNHSVAYADKQNNYPILIDNLLDKEVEMQVEIKHYNFASGKKRIIGWNINLRSIHPL